MSTSIAIASGAMIAAQNAQRSQEIAVCNGVFNRFDSFKATVIQMQEYAGCVNMIYPVDSQESVLFAKIAVGLSFLFAMAGIIYGKFFADHWSIFSDLFMAPILGLVLGWIALLVIGLAHFLVMG